MEKQVASQFQSNLEIDFMPQEGAKSAHKTPILGETSG